jgi:hypothetical protein
MSYNGGTLNIAAIAYGSVVQNVGTTTGLTNSFNCTLTSNIGSSTQITITNGANYKFFIPIISSSQGPNNVSVSMSSISLFVQGYAATGNGQNTNFNFVVFGS